MAINKMMTGGRALGLAVLLVGAVACDDAGDGARADSPQARAAARQACVAAEVLRRGSDDVQSIEEGIAGTDPESPAGPITLQAARAALQFARAYEQHADLRLTAFAHADSALNYAPRTTDSLRHARIADGMEIRLPEEGTLEANVILAYERDLAALLNDPDHPCNWELERR